MLSMRLPIFSLAIMESWVFSYVADLRVWEGINTLPPSHFSHHGGALWLLASPLRARLMPCVSLMEAHFT